LNSKWTTARLKDLALINRESYSRSDGWDFVNYLDTGSITKGVIDKITLIDLRHEKLPSRARRKVAPYDIIYSTVRPNQEHYGIIRHPVANMLVSTGFVTITAKEGVDAQYLYYYLSQPQITTYLHAIAEQRVSTYPALNVSDLEELPITVPPLRIQQEIGEMLSCLDAKIDLNDRMNENLEKQAQAIFKSWFVDFEPFHDGEFVDSVIGPIPKGWKACAVTDVIDVNPKRKLDKGTSAKYLSMANVSTSGPRVLGWEQRNFTSGTCFMNGDVLLARITPSLEHGKTAFVDFLADQEVGWGSTEFIVMRSREPLPLEYTYCLAKHEPFREHMIKSMTGTSGRQRAQVDALKHYFLAIAPKDVYAEFQEIVIPFFLAIRRNATENQVLAALRDTLLPKLMSGEIEVPVVY
jgi:type I restriction enzyme S subunit